MSEPRAIVFFINPPNSNDVDTDGAVKSIDSHIAIMVGNDL